MNLEVSIWTAYLFLEISGDTLVQLAGVAVLFGGVKMVFDLFRGR